MSKVGEALDILKELGMPKAQQNERSALTLLALVDIAEDQSWSEARTKITRVHDVLGFVKEKYGKIYAENTRETIRRQTLHQFVQGGIALINPDDLSRPTNSPKTVYTISPAALQAVRTYGSKEWSQALGSFSKSTTKLVARYDAKAVGYKVSLSMPGNIKISFSPGKHNELQKKVLTEFTNNFCPGSKLLYVGDTAKKDQYTDKAILSKLKIPFNVHDKLPDIILYDSEKDTLFLIEVVTSHGPVSPKRQLELEEALKHSESKRIYITAFPNFHEFKRHIDNIAWETEVWIAENPKHMIHFNGDKFLKI